MATKSKATKADKAVAAAPAAEGADRASSRKIWTEDVETELERLQGVETLLQALAFDADDPGMKHAIRGVCSIVRDVTETLGDAVNNLPAGGAS